MDRLPEFKPVKLHCTDADCANDGHCFRPKRGEWKKLGNGKCMHCQDQHVDMELTRKHRAGDTPAIFIELQKEYIRKLHFDKPLDDKAKRLIARDGYDGIQKKARSRIASRIGREPTIWDGRQTPFDGDVLNYAQHATATCCRRCTRYWYGFELEGELSKKQIDFCEHLVLAYLDRRSDEIKRFDKKKAAAR